MAAAGGGGAAGSAGGGGSDSWPGFLSELTKSFLILRDIFGYALPGAVFLSIGVLCRRFSLRDLQALLTPYHLPAWLAIVLGIGACYTAGHLMSGFAYFFYNTWKFPWNQKIWRFHWPHKDAGGAQDGHTQIPPDLIVLREEHPTLLIEYDRTSIMTQLRGTTGAAMVAGYLVFYLFPTPPIGDMAGFAGVFLLFVFWFSAIPNSDDLRSRTIAAGLRAEAADKAAAVVPAPAVPVAPAAPIAKDH